MRLSYGYTRRFLPYQPVIVGMTTLLAYVMLYIKRYLETCSVITTVFRKPIAIFFGAEIDVQIAKRHTLLLAFIYDRCAIERLDTNILV